MNDLAATNGKRAFARERVTVAATAVGLTAATYNQTSGGSGSQKATCAIIQPVTATGQINYTVDGTTPTGSIGLMAYGPVVHIDSGDASVLGVSKADVIVLDSQEQIAKFRAIRGNGVSTDIEVVYFSY